MKGILKKVELKEYTNKEKGNKFNRLNFVVDCENDKHEIITLKGNMSEDYARKYFKHCGLTTKEAIGKQVEVITGKKKFTSDNGEERTFTFIKFLNFLDDKGNPIIMKKDEDVKELDF